ncbi:MAG TPA: protein kinase [Blastocatellia bacterium]
MTALLNNRYRILKVLGAGGFGVTSIAEDTHLPSQRRCVVKELKPSTDDPRILQIIRERFQKEAATLEMLGQASRQIPGLYAYFAENERFYLVQELVDGPTLTQYVTQNGPLGEEEAKRILASLLALLDYVHGQGIIHRDIKPDNILIRRQDNQPVLIDFGAVKETVTSTLDSAGRATASIVIGTPGFIPLEQAAGRPLFSSDLYSLGLTIVFLLTGKVPQELTNQATGAISWMNRAPGISPPFAAIINKSIEPDSRARYRSAREMLEVLTQYAKPTEQELGGPNRQTVATPPPSLPRAQPNSQAGLPSSETQRWTQPPNIPSQPMPNSAAGQARNLPSEPQHWTPPPGVPSQPNPQPPSQGYQNYQGHSGAQPNSGMPQQPMPPSGARQAPANFEGNRYPTPPPQYPPQQQFPPQYPMHPGSGFAPAPVPKKGMSTAAKVVLVVAGLGILGVIGIVVLIALAQLGASQNQQSLTNVEPTPTPLISTYATPSVQPYEQGTPQVVENVLDVSGRWQFNLTMLNGETMTDVMNLQQDGEQVVSTDSEGDTAKGTLQGNKLTLAFKQQLSAEDRAGMESAFGDINSLVVTISGKVWENRMSGNCSVKTNTGLSIGGICKWTATR